MLLFHAVMKFSYATPQRDLDSHLHTYFSDGTLEKQLGVVPKLFKLSLIFILEV